MQSWTMRSASGTKAWRQWDWSWASGSRVKYAKPFWVTKIGVARKRENPTRPKGLQGCCKEFNRSGMGLVFIPVEDAVRDAVESLESRGFLKQE
ncbi:hypothetical protein M0R45_025765 [Rubus argutus]|uniref:Uncharacterized protein n=1 Tax=Rubus argutus TaxID=59490 RepID=A0AAW1WXD4_RUBAR